MNKLNAVTNPDTRPEEWVSALLDGELEADESRQAISSLGKDALASRRWAEYSLIGDVMRGCATDATGLHARVRVALADEPTILAPLPAAKPDHQPFYWMAAAAAVAAITWGVLSVTPQTGQVAPMAANAGPTATPVAANDVMPLLAAHQDYAYAVVSDPDMKFTPIAASEGGR